MPGVQTCALPICQRPAPIGSKGSVLELVPIFKRFGFECGAEWKNVPDGMHFEIKILMHDFDSNAAPETQSVEALVEALAKIAFIRDGARVVVDSSVLKDGHFNAQVREVLSKAGVRVAKQVNRLDELQPRVDLYLD